MQRSVSRMVNKYNNQSKDSELQFNPLKTEFLSPNTEKKEINVWGHSLTIKGFIGPYEKRLQRTLQNAIFSLYETISEE